MIDVQIMSGVPGSGKSHQANGFAKVMTSEDEEGIIISADHYFYPDLNARLGVGSGIYFGIPFNLADRVVTDLGYAFDPSKLPTAHQQCMEAFINALIATKNREHYTIVVDNTNIHNYEISPYYLVGEAMGAKVEIVRIESPLERCLRRNTHEVPAEIVTKMHETFSEDGPHPWEENVILPKQHMPWWISRTV